jgi:hypothetical protein
MPVANLREIEDRCKKRGGGGEGRLLYTSFEASLE